MDGDSDPKDQEEVRFVTMLCVKHPTPLVPRSFFLPVGLPNSGQQPPRLVGIRRQCRPQVGDVAFDRRRS